MSAVNSAPLIAIQPGAARQQLRPAGQLQGKGATGEEAASEATYRWEGPCWRWFNERAGEAREMRCKRLLVRSWQRVWRRRQSCLVAVLADGHGGGGPAIAHSAVEALSCRQRRALGGVT